MKKIRTLIVDDEPNSLEMLCGYINKFTEGLNIVGVATSATETIEQIARLQPRLILLDISMPGESGIQLIERYPNRNFEIIFVTAHKEYALKAFELGAINYLLKPIDIVRLQNTIEKAKTYIRANDPGMNDRPEKLRLDIPCPNGHEVIKMFDISYCKSEGGYTTIQLKNGQTHISSQNLKFYEQLLNNSFFFRVHRQYIINLNEVRSYSNGKSGHVTLECGTKLPISYRKKAEFINKLDL